MNFFNKKYIILKSPKKNLNTSNWEIKKSVIQETTFGLAKGQVTRELGREHISAQSLLLSHCGNMIIMATF